MLRIRTERSDSLDSRDVTIALTCATLNPSLRKKFYSLLPKFRQDKLLIRSIGATVSFAKFGDEPCIFFNLHSDFTQGNFHHVYLQMSKALLYLVETKDAESLILDRDYIHQQLLMPEIKHGNLPLLVLVFVSNHFNTVQKQKVITALRLPTSNDFPWAVFPIHLHDNPKRDLKQAFNWLQKALNFTNCLRDLKQFHATPFHELLRSILPNVQFQMNPTIWLSDAFGDDFLYFNTMSELLFHRFLELSFREFDDIASNILYRTLKITRAGDLTLADVLPQEFFTEDLMTRHVQGREARNPLLIELAEQQKDLEEFILRHEDSLFIERISEELSLSLKDYLQHVVVSRTLDKEMQWYVDMINKQITSHAPFLRFFLVQEFLPRIFFDHVLTKSALRERLLKRWFKLPAITQARRLYSELVVMELLLRMLHVNFPQWSLYLENTNLLAIKTTSNDHDITIHVLLGEINPELRIQVTCTQKKDHTIEERKTFTFTPCIVPEHQTKILYSSKNMVIKDYLLLVAKINLTLSYFSAINHDVQVPELMNAQKLIHDDIIEQFVHAFGKCPHFNWPLNL